MKDILEKRKFKKFREKLGFSQTSFAKKLEVSTGAIGMIEAETDKNKGRLVTASIKLKIQNKFNVNFDTDVDNEGNIIIKNNNNPENMVAIPFYSVKASAGTGELLPDYLEKDVLYFDRRWLKNVIGVDPNNVSMIQAKGDSMQSTPARDKDINDGDLLMVDESFKELINNQIFVVNLGGNEIVVKRVNKQWDGAVTLESNNPKYKSITPSEDAITIGKVVWNGSKENV